MVHPSLAVVALKGLSCVASAQFGPVDALGRERVLRGCLTEKPGRLSLSGAPSGDASTCEDCLESLLSELLLLWLLRRWWGS